jgi:hypothetical protein
MIVAEAPAQVDALPEMRDPGPKWYRIGIGDLVLLLLAIGIGQTASSGIINDPGLGWHLRTPDFILEHGWPTADPFSGPKNGSYWLANQWLGDLPLWLGWKAAGMNGVVAVTIAFLLLGYRLLYGFMRADGLSWAAAASWTLTAAIASFCVWVARPNLITFVSVTIVARVLALYHEDRLSSRRLLWLVPLFLAWANSHGGFVVGLVMIGLAAGIELLVAFGQSELLERNAAMLRFRALGRVGIACILATFINPYGWKIYPWVFSLLGDKYFMNLNQEWLSPDFHMSGWIRVAAYIVLFPAVFAVSRYRPKLTVLALSLFWLYLALKSQRYAGLWVVVTTPLMARAGAQIDWLNVRITRLEQDEFFRVRSGGWIGYVVIVAGLALWAGSGQPLDHNKSIYPCEGLRELLHSRQPGEVVLNDPDFGGFLTLYSWPDLDVWIDDRNEVHGRDWYERYFALEHTKPGWEENLAGWNPDWVAIHSERPLAYRLAERPAAWEMVYRDNLIVLFHKRKEQ